MRQLTRINRVVAVLFLVSAAIQFNDPDPWRWAAMYGGAALACWAGRRGPRPWLLPSLVGLASLIWALTYMPILSELRFGDLLRSMKAQTPAIEESRELLGLLIVAGWMALLVAFRDRPAEKAKS